MAWLCLAIGLPVVSGEPAEAPASVEEAAPNTERTVTEDDLAVCAEDADCIVVDYRSCCGSTRRAIHLDLQAAYEANPEWQVFDDPAVCAVIGICQDDSAVTEARCSKAPDAATGRCTLVFP